MYDRLGPACDIFPQNVKKPQSFHTYTGHDRLKVYDHSVNRIAAFAH